MSQIALNINDIINKRKPMVEKLNQLEHRVVELSHVIKEFSQHRNSIVQALGEDASVDRINEINFSKIHSELQTQLATMAKLKARFSRTTLNIGVIGRARQGKSRLLQTLSGLTAIEIPDGDRQHCTGVRSTIYHHTHDDSYAEVFFHSEQSFLTEIIQPYYEKLKLSNFPHSLSKFAENPLPALPQELPGAAEPGAKYEHLRKYHTYINQYRSLLRSPSPRRIQQHEIREFVAQDDIEGNRTYFNYLAVKEVRIYCNFQNVDFGKIAMIDMPGLGDTGIGDVERLIQAVGEDVDIVLFVRLPKSDGDYIADVDVQLYDVANSALRELPLHRWSFFVFNHKKGITEQSDNLKNCKDLQHSLSEKHINVVESFIADCSNAEESTEFFNSILSYMKTNIASLDHQYTQHLQKQLLTLSDQITSELEKAKTALGGVSSHDTWYPTFERLFTNLYRHFKNELEELVKKLYSSRDEHDAALEKSIDKAINDCHDDSGLPSEENVLQRRNEEGGYPNAYYKYMNEIRAHNSKHFLQIDSALKYSLAQVKIKVIEILRTEGRFSNIYPHSEVSVLKELVDLIEATGECHELAYAFNMLEEFTLSYRGLIQHRIRKQLDGLSPDQTTLTLSANPDAKEVMENLQMLHREAIYGCKNVLGDLVTEPNLAAFAIVEELSDRILRTVDIEMEWRFLYEGIRNDIWPDEFEALGERTRIRRQWMGLIEQIDQLNQRSHFQL